ncbi:MAG: hypothetical protein CFE43_02365 [Burkholderiales bacterium PBB3]|nr:MAG: hypothetical protein CFE43_02365 [Burkholderiales bacterium PBB3]
MQAVDSAGAAIKSLIGASVERVEHGTSLVDQAGVTMAEVVSSIKRVTDIMGEISAASNEQALGVAQVGEAVSQMDQTTQQNAALVEQMAAAASSLKGQAQELVQTVAVFQLADGLRPPAPKAQVRSPHNTSAPFPGADRRSITTSFQAKKTSTAPAVKKPPTLKASTLLASGSTNPKTQSKPAPAGGDDDWETF